MTCTNSLYHQHVKALFGGTLAEGLIFEVMVHLELCGECFKAFLRDSADTPVPRNVVDAGLEIFRDDQEKAKKFWAMLPRREPDEECSESIYRDNVESYFEGALSDQVAFELEAHILTCKICKRDFSLRFLLHNTPPGIMEVASGTMQLRQEKLEAIRRRQREAFGKDGTPPSSSTDSSQPDEDQSEY